MFIVLLQFLPGMRRNSTIPSVRVVKTSNRFPMPINLKLRNSHYVSDLLPFVFLFRQCHVLWSVCISFSGFEFPGTGNPNVVMDNENRPAFPGRGRPGKGGRGGGGNKLVQHHNYVWGSPQG